MGFVFWSSGWINCCAGKEATRRLGQSTGHLELSLKGHDQSILVVGSNPSVGHIAALASSLDQLIRDSSPDARRLLWILAVANQPEALGLVTGVWGGESFEQEQLRQIKQMLDMLPMLPPVRSMRPITSVSS